MPFINSKTEAVTTQITTAAQTQAATAMQTTTAVK